MGQGDHTDALQQQVREARDRGTALQIVAGGSKQFYGRAPQGEPLDVSDHSGIISYEPTELVLTARAGTPLSEIENALAEQGQMLAFEPPQFNEHATLGGAIAAGLSGPRRPYAGAARDFVLGITLLTGAGEVVRFGGQVMKNVAGYDVSRLMCGALGTLGVLLDVSLKVLPRPEQERTVTLTLAPQPALDRLRSWEATPMPLSGACHDGEQLYLRLSGAGSAVDGARHQIGGEDLEDSETFWRDLRDLRHPFFADDSPLWRAAVPPSAPPLDLPGPGLLDWGGTQQWFHGETNGNRIRRAAEAVNGHATLFRGGDRTGMVFHPLPSAFDRLHRRLKERFDPHGILNPGRLYPDW